MPFAVPLEIVRLIILAVYDGDVPPRLPSQRLHGRADICATTKPPWKAVNSLSQASKAFRDITLGVWFQTLNTSSPEHLAASLESKNLPHSTTRNLHCFLEYPPDIEFDLGSLHHVNLIRVDFRPAWMHCTGDALVLPLPVSPFLLFTNIPANVRELSMISGPDSVVKPYPSVFDGISSFSNLRVLRMRFDKAWCDLCHLPHVPILRDPKLSCLMYEGGVGLPIRYAKALASLERLELVSLTLEALVIQSLIGGISLPTSESTNQMIWSGECRQCVQNMLLNDSEFCGRWLALKKGEIQEIKGELSGLKFNHTRLPSLKKVEWHFDTQIYVGGE